MLMRLGQFRIFLIFITLGVVGLFVIQFQNFTLRHSRPRLALNIAFSWPGKPASIIEDQVTLKLEGLFSAIAGVSSIRSISHHGRGVIEIEFKNAGELDEKRFEVISIIRRINSSLPQGVTYPTVSTNLGHTADNLIYKFSIYSLDESQAVNDYIDKVIVPQVNKIDGVGKVQVATGDVFEWRIAINPEKMQVFKIKPGTIYELVKKVTSFSFFGHGLSEPGGTSLNMIFTTYASEIRELRQLPVALTAGRIIRLDDIADVALVKQMPFSYSRINGFNAINIQIFGDQGINVLRTTRSLDALIMSLSNDLPDKFRIQTTVNSSEDLISMIDRVIINSVYFTIFLFALALLVFRNFNAVGIIAICLIIDGLFFSVTYHLIGIQISIDSLICILVSLAFVMGAQCMLLHRWIVGDFKLAIYSVFRVSILMILCLCLLLFLPAVQFSPTYDLILFFSLNIAVSFLISWLFLPVIASYMLRSSAKIFGKYIPEPIKPIKIYRSAISFVKRYRIACFSVVILVIGFPYDLIFETGATPYAFLPINMQKKIKRCTGGLVTLFTENVFHRETSQDVSKTALVVSCIMSQENTAQQLNSTIKKIEKFISEFDEVDYYQTAISGPAFSEIKIYFKDEYEFTAFPQLLKSEIETATTQLGGAAWIVYGVGEGFSNSSVMASSENIVLEGFNRTVLHQKAEELAGILDDNKRVTDLAILDGEDRYVTTEYEYVLRFDPYYLAEHDFTLADVYEGLKNHNYDQAIEPVFLNGSSTQVRITTNATNPFSLWDLGNHTIEKDGRTIKLSKLASLTKVKTGDKIVRNNQQYAVSVSYNFLGPPFMQKKYNKEVVERFNKTLPLGYQVKEKNAAGQWDKESSDQYYFMLYLSVLIFLLICIYYESLDLGLKFVILIPGVFIGVLLSLYISDVTFDAGGVAAFYTVEIIAIGSVIYFIDTFYYGSETREARQQQITSALLSIFIFLMPLLVVFSILMPYKQAYWQSFAIGCVGGLSATTLFVPIFLPVIVKRVTLIMNEAL